MELKNINFEKIKKIYAIGIKGSGMVAVVEILKSMGIEIIGSDTAEKFFTDTVLQKLGISYFEKFSEKNIPQDADLVIYSTAYREDNNVEIVEAKKRKLPMASYPEILAKLFNGKYGVAVCGTHGKTTTSALLAHVLQLAGKDPQAVIGSRVIQWGSNALFGKGEFFVLEADEFQNKLRYYQPKSVILTSVDWDHPDFYPTFSEYKKAFSDFVKKIPKIGILMAWGDSRDVIDAVSHANCDILRYGFNKNNDFIISNFQFPISNKILNSNDQITQKFDLDFGDKNIGTFEMQLSGQHNALNAAAVIGMCHKLNLDMNLVREAVKNFKGTSRRFEIVGERKGAILIDDYGHHPEEIRVTLKAARERYPKKNIIVVFQPHSYSRTEALLHDFGQSFDSADQVILLDIYGSARESSGKVNSKDVVDLINKYNPGKSEHIRTVDEAVELLKDKIGADDVVFCISAGNAFEVAEKLKQ